MDALRLSQVRVPTADVSMVDFTVRLQRDASAESLAALFRGKAAAELKGVLGYTTEPLVSQDFVGCAALLPFFLLLALTWLLHRHLLALVCKLPLALALAI